MDETTNGTNEPGKPRRFKAPRPLSGPFFKNEDDGDDSSFWGGFCEDPQSLALTLLDDQDARAISLESPNSQAYTPRDGNIRLAEVIQVRGGMMYLCPGNLDETGVVSCVSPGKLPPIQGAGYPEATPEIDLVAAHNAILIDRASDFTVVLTGESEWTAFSASRKNYAKGKTRSEAVRKLEEALDNISRGMTGKDPDVLLKRRLEAMKEQAEREAQMPTVISGISVPPNGAQFLNNVIADMFDKLNPTYPDHIGPKPELRLLSSAQGGDTTQA
jgi:hypothetical protein